MTGWSWSFGDDATAPQQHPSHSYATGGTYSVQSTVTDDRGSTATTTRSVIVT